MKKLLISSLAVLALATSSLTLADTYNSNGTMKSDTSATSMKSESMKPGTEKLAGKPKVRVYIQGTNANGKPIRVSEVTINQRPVEEGKPLALTSDSNVVKVAESKCKHTNINELSPGQAIKEIHVTVKDGICEFAKFTPVK